MWSESVSLSVMNNFLQPHGMYRGAIIFFPPSGFHMAPEDTALQESIPSPALTGCGILVPPAAMFILTQTGTTATVLMTATVRKVLWKVFVNQIYSSYCINLAMSVQLKFRRISHACSKHLFHITLLETGKYNLPSAVWGSEHDKGVLPSD